MAIHYINAYEEEGEDGRAAAVVVDCCEHYGDPSIIETLVLHRLRSLRDKDVLPNARCYCDVLAHTWLSHCEPLADASTLNSFLSSRERKTWPDPVT